MVQRFEIQVFYLGNILFTTITLLRWLLIFVKKKICGGKETAFIFQINF